MNHYTSLVRHSGNRELFLFLELAILSQSRGYPLHIHVEGLRGTGKTTIIRAARQILPPIKRLKGCLYNCDPEKPHCPEHRNLSREAIFSLGIEEIPMPFLEISASAKVGTVVGTIDLSRITNSSRPEAALLPGTIPQAHRGIVFVDEINRLADTSPELADVLLDVMGTKPGRLQIEESGLPRVEIPVQVSVWAASNPDEDPGSLEDIRRQLSDRFDFQVEMGRPAEPQVVAAVLARDRGREQDGIVRDRKVQEELQKMACLLPRVEVDERIRQVVASLYTKFNLESLRAVEALLYGARVYIAREGRRYLVEIKDLLTVAPAALRHRVEPGRLAEILQHLKGLSEEMEKQVAATLPAQRETTRAEGRIARANRDGKLNLWQRAREFLNRLMERILPDWLRHSRRRRPGRSGGGGGWGDRPGSRSEQEGGRGLNKPQVSDPTHTPILAPPRRARPLFEIAAEGLIIPPAEEEKNASEN